MSNNFLDEYGRPIGNDCDYEYSGTIASTNNGKHVVVKILVFSLFFLFLLLGLFLFGYGLNIMDYEYIFGSAFFLALAVYILYRKQKYYKSKEALDKALKEFEEKRSSRR